MVGGTCNGAYLRDRKMRIWGAKIECEYMGRKKKLAITK